MYYTLYHHGIKGQRWGVRRFQNKDGTLTAAGRRRAEGAREDAASYKYNKPGESGWKGLKRAVKAKRQAEKEAMRREGAREDAMTYKYNKSGESGWKGMMRASEAKKKTAREFNPDKNMNEYISDGLKQRARQAAKVSAATGASSVATAAVTSAAVSSLAKKGKHQAAATVYAYGTATTQGLKTAAATSGVNAGLYWVESQWWK